MKIILAGATGAVGRLLVPRLAKAGHEVIAMTRSAASLPAIREMGAQGVVADALDREAVRAAVAAARPDAIVHQLTSLASRNFADNSRIRIEGTRNLVDAALETGVRKFVVQSIAWAYEPGTGPAGEETPLDVSAPPPRSTTIEGIVAMERAAAEIPDHVILRYGMFYGPGTWYERGGFMAEQVRLGQLPAAGGVTSFLHVEDAARAAVLALKWPSGAVNVVDDEPAAGAEWLPEYARLLGAPAPAAGPDGAPWERGASNAKARREFGWEPLYPTWRTGFAEALL
ncbi:dTDP-glucose 4,6-dehydratase [Cohnella xylanilytica]|uniref:NAD(P)-dependent oxidoreductase n=1 Tax=Cohnella xylanilytica TaxID=557555 RepID=A0A841U6K0_9BACL|nr:NAD(P)-dependent oxidoreductase [Cohnella xylanilytica]MBB6693674.1 NAD(P)-dependent oxidoreductase [Cohnella xylanilytica]GIO15221.1 dTDP-glucose 4,6-dehydratase [Cohnella xylanilytica]